MLRGKRTESGILESRMLTLETSMNTRFDLMMGRLSDVDNASVFWKIGLSVYSLLLLH